jgi:hypothetical protein
VWAVNDYRVLTAHTVFEVGREDFSSMRENILSFVLQIEVFFAILLAESMMWHSSEE